MIFLLKKKHQKTLNLELKELSWKSGNEILISCVSLGSLSNL